MACVRILFDGKPGPTMHVPRPDQPGNFDAPHPSRIEVPLHGVRLLPEKGMAMAEVIKDGGDDPDVTHGSVIRCQVRLGPALDENAPFIPIRIEGGRGIGRVTLPGLPRPVGQAAINPGPRRQIALAVVQAMSATGRLHEIDVLVESPQGEHLARKTMNPRLGIVHGISILGSSGIVKPFSHAAWRATVQAGLDVARAMGHDTVALCTGRRSERLLLANLPELAPTSCVQMADLFAFSLAEAAQRGFRNIVIGCFFGKLVKMAQGLEHTHADSGSLDFNALAERCASLGMNAEDVEEARKAVTARRVLDLALENNMAPPLSLDLARDALTQAAQHTPGFATVTILVFSTDESLLTHRSLDRTT